MGALGEPQRPYDRLPLGVLPESETEFSHTCDAGPSICKPHDPLGSILQTGHPVHDHCHREGGFLLDRRGDQKTPAIRRRRIVIPIERRTHPCVEQHLWNARAESLSHGANLDGHQVTAG
jgi:hypothetical protein